MNVSRGFLVTAPFYMIVGVLIGMYMAASNDHDLLPAHAHINLLGFVLMMLFGLAYHQFPAAGATMLARAHFWLHQVGSLVLLVMLFLLFTDRISEAAMVPLAPLAQVAILLGLICFAVNMIRHAR
jgi:cbb3-type cytochrome oxidase subunit 1